MMTIDVSSIAEDVKGLGKINFAAHPTPFCGCPHFCCRLIAFSVGNQTGLSNALRMFLTSLKK